MADISKIEYSGEVYDIADQTARADAATAQTAAAAAQTAADAAGSVETLTPVAVAGVTSLGSDHQQFRIGGRMVFGELVVNILTDVGPNTILATGGFPAHRGGGYHFCVRSTISGVMRSDMPVYIDIQGNLVTSGSAPTLHAGDQVTFSIPYYSTAAV